MMGRAVYLLLSVCLAMSASHTPVAGTARRSLSRLVGQQPLLFGRRGINPNMNSLFFGKRASPSSPSSPSSSSSSSPYVSLDELSAACNMLLTTYQQMMMLRANDS
ncbi:uncharacterized protein LOC143276380 [Babylonia areolata]|uniref:uncharacterized protein LOC143276380 n=1 Tax=Babylonia areolata TaxID=304850 RepID=UPI003FD3A58B